jgi:hypothetical protein
MLLFNCSVDFISSYINIAYRCDKLFDIYYLKHNIGDGKCQIFFVCFNIQF